MVQKLNVILITSQELVDFRRRLKSLETRVRLLPVKFIIAIDSPLLLYSKMVKLYSSRYIDHGVIMR